MAEQVNNVNSPEKLTKRDIFRGWLRWTIAMTWSTSSERLQALGFCGVLSPILEKLYKTKESLSAALKRHLMFFNTQGNWGAFIPGATIALEESKAHGADVPDEAIVGLKTGLMGPLAGIGDTLDWVTLGPILIAMFLPGAMEGSVISALMPLVLFTIPATIVSYTSWHMGYSKGKESFTQLLESGKVSDLITGSSVLGLFMMGAISASMVKVSTPLSLTFSEQTFALQEILNKIVPGLLPLAAVLGVYFYLEKAGPKYVRVIIGLLIIGIVLGALGILG